MITRYVVVQKGRRAQSINGLVTKLTDSNIAVSNIGELDSKKDLYDFEISYDTPFKNILTIITGFGYSVHKDSSVNAQGDQK